MEAVIVEFDVGSEQVDACVQALTELTVSLVSKQAAFHGNTILVEHDTRTVANMMLWDKVSDFVAFRDNNADVIGPALAQFGPKPRFYNIAHESV